MRSLTAVCLAVFAVAACKCGDNGGNPCNGVPCPVGQIAVGDNCDCVQQNCKDSLCGPASYCDPQSRACKPAKCYGKGACPQGQSCGADGECHPTACQGQSQCPAGQLCDESTGQCADNGCVPHKDCGADQVCSGGECIPVSCDATGGPTCSPGQVCVASQCVPAGCAHCPACCLAGTCPNIDPTVCSVLNDPPFVWPDGGNPGRPPPSAGADGGPEPHIADGGAAPPPSGCDLDPESCMADAGVCAGNCGSADGGIVTEPGNEPGDPPLVVPPPQPYDRPFVIGVAAGPRYESATVNVNDPNHFARRGYSPVKHSPAIPIQDTLAGVRMQMAALAGGNLTKDAPAYAGTVFLGNLTRCGGMWNDTNGGSACGTFNQYGTRYTGPAPTYRPTILEPTDAPSLATALYSDRHNTFPVGAFGSYGPILLRGPRESSMISLPWGDDEEQCYLDVTCSPQRTRDPPYSNTQEVRWRMAGFLGKSRERMQPSPRNDGMAGYWSGWYTPLTRFFFLAAHESYPVWWSGREVALTRSQLDWVDSRLGNPSLGYSALKVVFLPAGLGKAVSCSTAREPIALETSSQGYTLAEILKWHKVRVVVEGDHDFVPKKDASGKWDITPYYCVEPMGDGNNMLIVRVPGLWRVNPDDDNESSYVQLLFGNGKPVKNSVALKVWSSGAYKPAHSYGEAVFDFSNGPGCIVGTSGCDGVP